MAIRPECTVTLRISVREDGGLRVRSEDLPGLILSSKDRDALWADLIEN